LVAPHTRQGYYQAIKWIIERVGNEKGNALDSSRNTIIVNPGRPYDFAPFTPMPLLTRRTNADTYLRYILVAFAATIVLTRAFLDWTGYPQIATGDFHLAHVLWGGLLLFAAALIFIIWHGRPILQLASILTGVGFGLFIDEVGKFITASNNYFYPLAAPIIYAFFLITLFIYLRLRRPPAANTPPNPHELLDLLEQALDPNLSPQEYQAITGRLHLATHASNPHLAQFAQHTLDYLQAENPLASTGRPPSYYRRLLAALTRWFTPSRLKPLLIGGFLLLALRGLGSAIAAFIFLRIALTDPQQWRQLAATPNPLSAGDSIGLPHLFLILSTLVIEALIGSLFLAATTSLLTRRTPRGLTFGYWGLVISLTAVHLLTFYFNQFDAILTTLFQSTLLLALLHYRSHYLTEPT
jgi:hypothetical protein